MGAAMHPAERFHDELLQACAERALARMKAAGFEQAQAQASLNTLTELNIENNQPALLRGTETVRLALVGIVDARRASTELSSLDDAAMDAAITELHHDAMAAPRDEAHAVSGHQRAQHVQGPLACDTQRLATSAAELLDFRAGQCPSTIIKEAAVSHRRRRVCWLTSGGSELRCDVGHYELGAVFNAQQDGHSSSFNFAGGNTHDLASAPAHEHFRLGELMQEVASATQPRPLASLTPAFDGEVVLTPGAAADLFEWLLGQLGDERLLSGTSMYRDRVGERIASPLLTFASRFDAPGHAGFSADGFVARPLTLLDKGQLTALTPSLYASHKTGLPHQPVADGGWSLHAGNTSWRELLAAVPRGALVTRLSMGRPAANGDFAGVVKNSFLIEGGHIGVALAETMVSGNVARMLQDVLAVSRERVDTGAWCLPWLRVGGMRFS